MLICRFTANFMYTKILLLFISLSIVNVSCNLTKNIPENKDLLIKNKVIIQYNNINSQKPDFSEKDIEQILKPRLNTKIFGIPLKLIIYNSVNPEKIKNIELKKTKKCEAEKNKKLKYINKKLRHFDKETDNLSSETSKYKHLTNKISKLQNRYDKITQKTCKEKHWTRRLGEAPVLYNLNNEYRNKNKIQIFLKEKGFYDFNINSKIKSEKNNPKKITVEYIVKIENSHKIKNIYYNINDQRIKSVVLNDTAHSAIKIGENLDINNMENERERLASLIRDKGYYNFSKDFITFSADTVSKNKQDDLWLIIKKDTSQISNNIYKRYKIKNVYIYPYFKARKALTDKNAYFLSHDTLIYYDKNDKKYFFLYNQMPRINPKAIIRGIFIKAGDYYNLNDVNATYRYLVSLPVIQIANVKFTETENDNDSDTVAWLNCEIRLTQSKLQSTNTTAELTNTSGNFGVGGTFSYIHNNIFRNAGVLNVGTKLAFKRLTKNKSYLPSNTSAFFNSEEYGVNFSLDFPRLLAPVPLKKFFKRRNPKTVIAANYNFLQRPDYTYTVAGGNIGYYWNSSQTISHAFLPVTADVVDLRNSTQEFRDLIKILQLEDTYETHFVFGTSYKFTLNNQFIKGKKNTFLFTFNIKLAGNSLSAVMKALDKPQENGSYRINNIVFAQFIKEDIELRFHKKLSRENDKIAFRLFTGAALPYGNLKVIPFGERYFAGGASSVRAWQSRTLGPGSYSLSDTLNSYPNQTADIRLEANIEYRMKLFWKLEGALFVDAGNIWAINDEDIRPGAKFNFNTFYKEIAVGTGYGLRFDFGFVLLRADMGLKLFDPSLPVNNRWVYRYKKFGYDDWTFYLAIGYPF